MKAFEKWPEFMRSGSQPSASASREEGELELDTAVEVKPRRKPQQGRRVLRAQGRAAPQEGRGRRLVSIFMIGAIVGVVGVGGFLGYKWFFGGGGSDVPVIQAMDDPVKVKPENPGGLEVPYQDRLVLNQPANGSPPVVERLLPPPETPKPVVDTTAAARPAVTGSGTTGVGSITTSPGGSSSSQFQGQIQPRTQARPPAQAQPAQPRTQAGGSGTTTAASTLAAAPSAAAPAGAAQPPASPARQVQAALPRAKATAPAKGSYLLQLGSFNSKQVGEDAWSRFQSKFPDLLAGMVLYLQEADVNGRTYHRVQAGPFPNRATAIDLCAELKSRKQDCLVVKR
ncbi:MAG: SPOR domain-containing protein [Kiloniellales bacterium]|nr:SPOR domain-containing protein [Kiloniellales bacterium]